MNKKNELGLIRLSFLLQDRMGEMSAANANRILINRLRPQANHYLRGEKVLKS
uniref:Uncharacterized protein n=1 Tax=Anguilla anguilla TaxID=7936 RepID=A0A0E9S187_ANGAN